jgi:hypothetical protein
MENEHSGGCGHESHPGHNHDNHTQEDHTHRPDCGCEGHNHEAHAQDGHAHGSNCGCEGHEDHHHHGSGCECGEHGHEEHLHHHGPGCGCEGHEHGREDGPDYENGLSIAENNVLMALLDRGGLPVAQFTLTSSKEAEAYAVAMGPVYIADPSESLEVIRGYGALYAEMEHKGLIELDYDFPLPGYPYQEYLESAAWGHFVETAAEAKQRGFTFDTPHLELGGISLTKRGHEVIDKMLG